MAIKELNERAERVIGVRTVGLRLVEFGLLSLDSLINDVLLAGLDCTKSTSCEH